MIRKQQVRLLPLAGFALLLVASVPAFAAPATPAPATTDNLGRSDPRSAVTSFLEACRAQDYQKASEYLDLRGLSEKIRAHEGPLYARDLEAILNSDAHFSVLRLSQNPEGNLSDDSNPNLEHITTISQDGESFPIDMERVTLQPGEPQVWLFSQNTVEAIPDISVNTITPAIEHYLPPFLVSTRFLETPLWKWLALFLLTLVTVSLSRLLDGLIVLVMKIPKAKLNRRWNAPWLEAILQPVRVMVWLAILRMGIAIIDPSAIARLYIGRGLELIFVWSIAWCVIRLTDLLIDHLELRMDTPQQLASRTMLHLGRRTANATVTVVAILFVLGNWGYNTSTLIAGLGVGGIAVALAAQQTIANVFGGVSLIGDHPIRIGEFGKFGDMTGVVEDIGMRSTRIRTLNRTVVSVPNSNFAGLNLENYSVRDKILFNPNFQIKRTTTDEQAHALMDEIAKTLKGRKDLEPAPTPARLVGVASGAFTLEIFCYVLTADMNQFYKIQNDLLLDLNRVFNALKIELA